MGDVVGGGGEGLYDVDGTGADGEGLDDGAEGEELDCWGHCDYASV